MKYVIVIPDGCADEPQTTLGGRTPLQAARKPAMNRVAQQGAVGRSNNVPPTLTPASDVATLSLLGYDPLEVYTGRAPLETAAMGIPLGPNDWAFRCNLITVENGTMKDFTAGHVSNEEGRELIEALRENLDGALAEQTYATLEFHQGVSYRNIMVYRPGPEQSLFNEKTKTQPPHDIPDLPILIALPDGPGSEVLIDLMKWSRDAFRDHPVNLARQKIGKPPVTQAWLWGQGRAPKLEPFSKLYGKQGAMISAVDLVRGVGVLLGWNRIDVPGATGYLDTDYAAKGRAGIEALRTHDIVCVHIEAPDEASHEGRADAKVEALERIDQHIVGPLLEALPAYGSWRMLITPDHRTTLRTRAHAHGPVPFAWAGTGIAASGQTSYDECVAEASSLVFEKGHELMRRFLG